MFRAVTARRSAALAGAAVAPSAQPFAAARPSNAALRITFLTPAVVSRSRPRGFHCSVRCFDSHAPDSASSPPHPSRAAQRAVKRQWVGGPTPAAGATGSGSSTSSDSGGSNRAPPPPPLPPFPPQGDFSSSSSSSAGAGLPLRPFPPFPSARRMIFRWPWTIVRIYRAYFLAVESWSRTATPPQIAEFRRAMLQYFVALIGWAGLYGGAIWVWFSLAISSAIVWMARLSEPESSRIIERWFSVIYTPEGCAAIKEMVKHERERNTKQQQQLQKTDGSNVASDSEGSVQSPQSKDE